MSVLFTAHTGSGVVTVTEQSVTLDKPGGMASETINRASITGVGKKTTMVSILGVGGRDEVTISTQDGRRLVLKLMKPSEAKQLLDLLR